jgi:hypothetical protein
VEKESGVMAVLMFHREHFKPETDITEMACSRCKRSRALVLFRTPKNTYSTVCQACRTEEERRDEAFMLKDFYRRHKRVVPLREKRGRGICGA